MIAAVTNMLTNSTLSAIASNTTGQMVCETTLKAIGRPGAILIDNKISDETKRYASVKEFLYQATCLLVYALLIIPVFKHGTFNLAKNIMGKTNPEIKQFKNVNQYLDYYKLSEKSKQNRIASLNKDHSQDKFTRELREHLKTADTPERYDWIKGAVETGSFIGSILGLAILAPQISHLITRPALRRLGFEKETKIYDFEIPQFAK